MQLKDVKGGKKLYSTPSKCAVCGSELNVTRMTCSSCSSEVTGSFIPCKYCSLNEKQKLFMETFLRCRGNIKEVERTLSISYPTVKGLLEDLLATLYGQEEAVRHSTADVLDMLEKGIINAQEAASLISGDK